MKALAACAGFVPFAAHHTSSWRCSAVAVFDTLIRTERARSASAADFNCDTGESLGSALPGLLASGKIAFA